MDIKKAQKPLKVSSFLLFCCGLWPLTIFLLTNFNAEQPMSSSEIQAIIYALAAALVYTFIVLAILQRYWPKFINDKPLPLLLLYLVPCPSALIIFTSEPLSINALISSTGFYLIMLLPNFRTSTDQNN